MAHKSITPRTSNHLRAKLANEHQNESRFPVVVLHQLCHLCRLVSATVARVFELERDSDHTEFRHREAIDHYSNLSELQQSAHEGCHLCLLLVRGTTRLHQENTDGSLTYTFRYGVLPSTDSNSSSELYTVRNLSIEVAEDRNGSKIQEWFSVRTDSDIPEDIKPRFSLRHGSTASNACFDLAIAWLRNCLTKHELCARATDVSFLPTRLLFAENGPDGIKIRLCLVEDLIRPVRYATVSHCWGKGNHVKLTRKNTGDFAETIPVEYLSKTFLDAIIVTLRLGLNYL